MPRGTPRGWFLRTKATAARCPPGDGARGQCPRVQSPEPEGPTQGARWTPPQVLPWVAVQGRSLRPSREGTTRCTLARVMEYGASSLDGDRRAHGRGPRGCGAPWRVHHGCGTVRSPEVRWRRRAPPNVSAPRTVGERVEGPGQVHPSPPGRASGRWSVVAGRGGRGPGWSRPEGSAPGPYRACPATTASRDVPRRAHTRIPRDSRAPRGQKLAPAGANTNRAGGHRRSIGGSSRVHSESMGTPGARSSPWASAGCTGGPALTAYRDGPAHTVSR